MNTWLDLHKMRLFWTSWGIWIKDSFFIGEIIWKSSSGLFSFSREDGILQYAWLNLSQNTSQEKGLKGYVVYRYSHNHAGLFSALGLELCFPLCLEFLSLKLFQFFPSLPFFPFSCRGKGRIFVWLYGMRMEISKFTLNHLP